MPEIRHTCGAKLKFPPGMEGRRGKCPTCGETVDVPHDSSGTAQALGASSGARPGLAPAPRSSDLDRIELLPPPNWDQYQAFIDGKGPNPRPVVVPMNLMLKEEADEKWKIAEERGPPSKFVCPGCKTRLDVGVFVCTGCGLDLRTGRTLDGKTKVNDKGLEYLAKIPWLKDAPPAEDDGPKKPLLKRKPRRMT